MMLGDQGVRRREFLRLAVLGGGVALTGLLAAWESKRATVELFGDGREGALYLAGVRDTITAIALTFSIAPGSVLPRLEPREHLHKGE